jgi:hypothetical protein
MSAEQKEALERLLAIALQGTGQSRRVADFLLAWWNAGECGGFDFTTMWGLRFRDRERYGARVHLCGHHRIYPDSLGYGILFENVVREWRPQLVRS